MHRSRTLPPQARPAQPRPPQPHSLAAAVTLAYLALAPAAAQAQAAPPASSSTAPPASSAAAPPVPGETQLPAVPVRGSAVGEDYSPGISTIGGKAPTPIRDIPQSVTVINRPVMDAQGAASLQQALRNVPGITLSAGEGGQIGDNINVRGFSARTDLFLDGMRDRGQYTRDTFFLESVEVLKGPSSMLFGRGSTGGVINQVAKHPVRQDITEVAATLGEQDYRRATVDVNRKLSDTSAIRVAGLVHDAGSQRDQIQSSRQGVAPSLRFGIGTPTTVTLSALVQRSRDVPDYGFPLLPVNGNGVGTIRKPINAPANTYYGYLDDHFDQDVTVLNGSVEHKINADMTLRNQTQYSGYHLNASPSPLGTVTSTQPSLAATLATPLNFLQAQRQDRDRTIVDTSLYNQTDLIWKIRQGGMLHTLATGLELGQDDYDFTRSAWTPTNVNINLGVPVNGSRGGSRTLLQTVNARSNSAAAYINDQLDITRQWKLVAGLRWDRFQVKSTQVDYSAAGAVLANSPVSHLDTMWSTRAGVIYQPSSAASLYVSYGTSLNPSTEAVTLAVNNLGLSPEKNRSYEAGAKLDFMGGELSLTSALFRVEKTNARTTDPVTGLINLAGNVRVDGFEIGAVGRITSTLQVIAGYTFLDGKIVRSQDVGTGADLGIRAQGKTYPNTPRNTFSAWTTWNFMPGWEAGGGVTHVGDRYLNNFETALTDGYTRADATIAWRQPKYDVRFNLLNVTDKIYYETASGGRATPTEGRKLLATLTYRF